MIDPPDRPGQPPRILVAGIGNIFLGDDAFGVHVAQQLHQRCHDWPENVHIRDFGIRGLDLVYALLDGCDVAIFIDAVPRGEKPGTLFLIEPDLSSPPSVTPIEAHSMDPVKVLNSARSLGAKTGRVLIVGCEPTPIDHDTEMQMELSPPVAAAVAPAIERVETLIAGLSGQSKTLITEDSHVQSNLRPGT